jgi:flagellar biosynthesis/type III secretory pathway chaperone
MLKTLNAQLKGYENMLELLKREKGLLVSLDTHGVEELSKEKDTLVLRLRLLEEERFRIQKKLAMELAVTIGDTNKAGLAGRDASSSPSVSPSGSHLRTNNIPMRSIIVNNNNVNSQISLRQLQQLTGVEEFNDIRLKLVSLVQSINEINDFNKILIDRSLSYVRSSVEIYNSFGYNSNVNNIGNLITREA